MMFQPYVSTKECIIYYSDVHSFTLYHLLKLISVSIMISTYTANGRNTSIHFPIYTKIHSKKMYLASNIVLLHEQFKIIQLPVNNCMADSTITYPKYVNTIYVQAVFLILFTVGKQSVVKLYLTG